MTDLMDPGKVEIPETTPAEPMSAFVPADRWNKRRRSQRFTVRTDGGIHSYPSWERAIGAARSSAVEFGIASTITDDNSGTRFDVTPDGCASPTRS